MSKEYISREAALSYPFANEKYDHEHADEHFISGCESYKEWLKTIPAADVVEVRHGRWETVMLDHERMGCRPTAHYCSECHQITWFRTFYCPNCGAKMDGGKNDAAD